jgi:SAM-dependent methyltransferase
VGPWVRHPTAARLPDHSRDWYAANARRYDRLHPGLHGDGEFYAGRVAGRRVLEIGAGTGRVTAALAPVARSVLAVDFSLPMLRLAAVRLAGVPNVRLLLADARSLPLAGPVDAVLLPYRVVHHFGASDRERLWAAISAILAPGGLLAFDSWHGPMSADRRGRRAPPSAPIEEVELQEELGAAELEVESCRDRFSGRAAHASYTRVWTARRRPFVRGNTFTKLLTLDPPAPSMCTQSQSRPSSPD